MSPAIRARRGRTQEPSLGRHDVRVSAILLYGDTARHASLRHEVPLVIIDPFLFAERGGRTFVMTNVLERTRIAEVLPKAELTLVDDLGRFELIAQGRPPHEIEVELAVRAARRWEIADALVPPEFPVAIADALRAGGISVRVDAGLFAGRRRVKTPRELDGIRRAQRAAEAGMGAGERLIRAAERVDGRLRHEGAELTAEAARNAIRSTCAVAGAPAPPEIMVVSAWSGGGHDSGSGPLPANLPITIDLWPCDEASGCWADMTRTFVNGEVTPEVATLRGVVREALEAARAAVRPGVTGRALYDAAAEVVERAGHPTQRTREEGETLTHGFYFSLGHGVGLEVHEAPGLGLSGGSQTLVAGDVLALEPGVENVDGIGGVRFEDLVLVTEDGCETLTRYPYEL